MSIFKYTLPSGRRYVVEGPSTATQSQADYIFYSQIAAGSLVNYSAGQTLISAETRLAKFGYSRLDRTIAGTDINTVLAIISGSPVIATTPPLNNIPLTNPITAADVALTGSSGLPVAPVGPLTSSQTTALIAQIAKLVNQDSNTVSTTKGVGTYGLTPSNLEEAGYLKPGTSNYPDFNCVVGTPSVWTGKDGITSLAGILGDTGLQTQIQAAVMQNSYDALVAGGTIQTTPTQPVSLASGQVYTASGLTSLTAATLLSGTSALTTPSLNAIVSTAFAGAGNISSLLSNPVTSIETLASGAVNSITQGVSSLGANALTTANNLVSGTLNSLTSQASSLVTGVVGGAVGQATTTLNNLTGGLTTGVAGSVAGLITNASQFGAPVAAAWAAGSTALTGALGSATGIASGFASQAQGAITGALGDLTNMASTALGPITAQAQQLLTSLGGSLDIFGKMSNFSIDFSLFSSDSLVSPTKIAAGFSNTVNRQTVDAAVARILGNAKIPTPTFEYPSLGSINLAADIRYAQNKLNEIAGTASGAISSAASGVVNSASSAISGLIG
jgi:hypothetical protein